MGEAIKGTLASVAGQALETRLWQAEGQPRAVVQLVHGMAEHIDRYDETARRFNAAGFAVVGHTQLGHGSNAAIHGDFGSKGGWDALLSDVDALRKQTQERFPGKPYFLLGHSMGSFVVRTYCLGREAGLTGVILSGTGHFEPGILSAGLAVSRVQRALGMGRKPGKLLNRISCGGYCKRIENPRTPFDWLTTDEKIVDEYIADPHCGFPFTVRGYAEMFGGLRRMLPENLASMDKSVPVLLFSGDQDPVGDFGAGVKTTARELEAAGIKDVTAVLYENGRHEMFNEAQREAVCNDVISWMERYL